VLVSRASYLNASQARLLAEWSKRVKISGQKKSGSSLFQPEPDIIFAGSLLPDWLITILLTSRSWQNGQVHPRLAAILLFWRNGCRNQHHQIRNRGTAPL
jgi:hypothetical protein